MCVCEWELDSETRVENSLAKLCGIVNRRMCRGRVRSSLRCSIRSSLEQRLKLSRPDNGGRQDHVGLASRVYPALVLPVASFVAPHVEGKFRSKEEVKHFDFSIYRDCYEAVRFSFFVDRFEFFLFFFFLEGILRHTFEGFSLGERDPDFSMNLYAGHVSYSDSKIKL